MKDTQTKRYERNDHIERVYSGEARDHHYTWTNPYGPSRPEERTTEHVEILHRLALQLAHVLPGRRAPGDDFGDNVCTFVTAVRDHPDGWTPHPRYLVDVRSLAESVEPSFTLDVEYQGHYTNNFRLVAPGLDGAYSPLVAPNGANWRSREVFQEHLARLVLGEGSLIAFHDALGKANAAAAMIEDGGQYRAAIAANARARRLGEAVADPLQRLEAQRLWREKGFSSPLAFSDAVIATEGPSS